MVKYEIIKNCKIKTENFQQLKIIFVIFAN